jgi:hypothetical protein
VGGSARFFFDQLKKKLNYPPQKKPRQNNNKKPAIWKRKYKWKVQAKFPSKWFSEF